MSEVPQEPQPPPQQPPPAELKSISALDSPWPAVAKVETRTFVRLELQLGQAWPRSRSANEVSTSKLPEQLSHRYS